jgi:hypothetical protein
MDDNDEKDSLPFRPPHPGEILREDILPSLGMRVNALAKHCGRFAAISIGARERKARCFGRNGSALGISVPEWSSILVGASDAVGHLECRAKETG